jgi:excisionase family DNA binding protein
MGEIFTLAEAAGYIRVSRRHLAELLARGEGPPVVRLGRRAIIMGDALRAWLQARQEQPGARPAA